MAQEDLHTRIKTRYGMHRLFLDPEIAGVPQEFPFRTRFSLRPLIDQWRRMAEEDPDRYGALLEELEMYQFHRPYFKLCRFPIGAIVGMARAGYKFQSYWIGYRR